MKKLLFILMFAGCAHALAAQAESANDKPLFHPAEATAVSDIALPTHCTVSGTVVLEALITEAGTPQSVEVRRDTACLTDLAVEAVKTWKFSPATMGDHTVASRITVAVTFCPPGSFADSAPLPLLRLQSDAAVQARVQAAEVTRAKYPKYPDDSFVEGTVVLAVDLDAKGATGDVKVLQDLPPLTAHDQASLDGWAFAPATDNGDPVASKIILAFVSRPASFDNN